ncbi:MAG: phosphoribosyl-AMP cyclohydrolase [Deltaproteobacteria bacterium]|nr:MAG: phosphoribosyl-AMP cyclohydrolase [Deltaproteobacteria bacterium]
MDELLRAIDFEKHDGLVTAIAQDDASGEVLMVAWMNEQALRQTLASGQVHYWSRSRNALWRKGESSGNVQLLRSLSLDCDGDAVLLRVEQRGGAACHTGKRSCFFRRMEGDRLAEVGVQVFDPAKVYGR